MCPSATDPRLGWYRANSTSYDYVRTSSHSGTPVELRRYTYRMPSNAYTGRVCSLAVAVGVGAAVVSGWGSGLAWADDSPGSAGSNVSRNEAGPSGATKPGSADDADSHDATTATSAAVSGTDVPNPEDEALRSTLPRVVIGTGGFRRHAWGPTITSPDAGETAATSRSDDDDGSPSTPARPKGSDRRAAKATSTRGPAPVSTVADIASNTLRRRPSHRPPSRRPLSSIGSPT